MRSRATTPLTVGSSAFSSAQSLKSTHKALRKGGLWKQWGLLDLCADSESPEQSAVEQEETVNQAKTSTVKCIPRGYVAKKEPGRLHFSPSTSPHRSKQQTRLRPNPLQDITSFPPTPSAPSRRGHPLPRPSALPVIPKLDDATSVPLSADAEYTVLISMYEVYNDRIFDLLSLAHHQAAAMPGAGAATARRRPLLFKSTEAARERKVVAGLRKVACGSYEEALLVLEAGLTERRVAGTGSNSVSSRSHGFVCVEVKRRLRGAPTSAWSGAQMTIVDLAGECSVLERCDLDYLQTVLGSERARNAKTTGATLAEAGKINESLMYLGQCLQMQGDSNADGAKPSGVPFRQCKLTELLFSNSFPSHLPTPSGHPTPGRNPQRGVMIITADPLGDFNATSQILRYAALAREVTVPRIPSVTDIVFNGAGVPSLGEGKPSGPSVDPAALDAMETELASLGDQVEILAMRLAEEQQRRKEAEEGWRRAEGKVEEIEVYIRDECWAAAERRIEEERRRWIYALEDQV